MVTLNSTLRKTARLGLPIALCTLVSCAAQSGDAGAPGTSEGGSAAAVTLKYAWPMGLQADVRSTAVKSQSIGGQSRVQDLVSTYTMDVRDSGEETSIAFENFQVVRSGSERSVPAVDRILAYRPGFTVDKNGELAKVIGLDTLREMMPPLQRHIETAPDKERQGLEVLAQTITSERYLKARAGSEWSHLIGSWIGQTLVPGETKTTTVDSEPSGFVDTPLKTEVKISMKPIGECNRGGPRNCVRLWMTREPDAAELRAATLPNIGKMLGIKDWGPKGAPELRSVVATSKLIVDAELDTLVPHRVETLRLFSLEMLRDDGTLEVRDSNRVTSEFTYR